MTRTAPPADLSPDTPSDYARNDRDRQHWHKRVPLGEELPLFCERCGYSLNGCPQAVCDRCAIRHFACPECGHHQPINTLRPAAQRVLGRARALGLAFLMVIRINFFGWILVGWAAAGSALAYTYTYTRSVGPSRMAPREFESEAAVVILIFGLLFGLIGRLQLLRWRRGYLVGVILGVITAAALLIGAHIYRYQRSRYWSVPMPLTFDFAIVMALAAGSVTLGASIAWGVWSALVQLMLPKRAATALLEWQRSESDRPLANLAQEPVAADSSTVPVRHPPQPAYPPP